MRISKLAAAMAFVAILAACTSGGGEKGTPTPAPQTNTSSGNDSSGKLPERPANLKVDSVDACKLLTADQTPQIETSSSRAENLELVDGKESASCHYENAGRYTYTIGGVTHNGVDYWLKGGNFTTKIIRVADYGAVQIELSGGSGFDCSVAIDVADGQQLMVSYIPLTTGEKDQAVLCSKAAKAAGLALATLKTLK
ncbi:DUF3558 domain-containing protein [Lentzea sp. NEAU-D7]|uniref:DUF3558 domain-containing protein n=1 Tax=Lentzea sp. NEAU-D7 TaxID=2994667 RepID=UPI00224A996B|nr:DUF3558 domain-containing protein [Lentzea sp. NEAU-D7]MCX2948252.1 DUF3558 domain-containing protein [Lentzea sp. NEAU-D7]